MSDHLIIGEYAESTYSGAMPNRRAEASNECTPKKNEIFSRVRTTLAECHAWVRLVIRAVIYTFVGL
jgi:hypothetical protein